MVKLCGACGVRSFRVVSGAENCNLFKSRLTQTVPPFSICWRIPYPKRVTRATISLSPIFTRLFCRTCIPTSSPRDSPGHVRATEFQNLSISTYHHKIHYVQCYTSYFVEQVVNHSHEGSNCFTQLPPLGDIWPTPLNILFTRSKLVFLSTLVNTYIVVPHYGRGMIHTRWACEDVCSHAFTVCFMRDRTIASGVLLLTLSRDFNTPAS
jgi:hypothetical protein